MPTDVPPVFAGQRLLVYGLVTGALPHAARLTATQPAGVQTWDVRIDEAPAPGTTVTTLAARSRIRELEEGADWTGLRGSRQRGRKDAAVRQQIIDLAVRHGLMSRETSFVAVERRTTPVIGDVQLRRVPVMLANGWGGTSRRGRPAGMPMSIRLGASMDDGDALDRVRCSIVMASAPAAGEPDLPVMIRRSVKAAWSLRGLIGRRPRRPAALDELVALQAADGSWALSPALARIVERDVATLEARLPDTSEATRRAWATALAIVWLEEHASEWQPEWHLLSAKARQWLARRPADVRDGWIDVAREVLADGA